MAFQFECLYPLAVLPNELNDEQALARMQAVADANEADGTLPALKDSPSELLEQVYRIRDAVLEFLRGWTGEGSGNVDWGEVVRIALIGVGVVAVLLVIAGLYLLIRRAAGGQAHWQAVAPAPGHLKLAAAEHEELLAQGDFRGALRARWRLHLLESGLPGSRTPREVLAGEREHLRSLDSSMFSHGPFTLEGYRQAAALFAPREGGGA